MKTSKAQDALNRLQQGNDRYVNNLISVNSIPHSERRESLVAAQNPFAVILSCSDSRAPSELIFDQGLGDLFVVRVAGNVVAPSILGSVEFAVTALGVPLVVVMGHSNCGAVTAAIDAFKRGTNGMSRNVADIVERIYPAVEENIEKQNLANHSASQLLSACVRSNVEHSIKSLVIESELLFNRVKASELTIVGAEYDLTSGKVEFFYNGETRQNNTASLYAIQTKPFLASPLNVSR